MVQAHDQQVAVPADRREYIIEVIREAPRHVADGIAGVGSILQRGRAIPCGFIMHECHNEPPRSKLRGILISPFLDGMGWGRVINRLQSPPPNLPHQGGGTYLVTL